MNIKYTSPATDYSGYGEASRHDIAALHSAGVQVKTQIPKYTLEIANFGRLGELVTSLQNNPIDYNIQILHTTPNVYPAYMEAQKYHIGRAFWETDKVPLDFAIPLQMMDEIWTGSQFNKQAMINAGVTKPIYIIPEAIDIIAPQAQPYIIPFEKSYKFYSIFEWTERKNPTALLEAYFLEFQNDENVTLTLKTYVDNFTPDKKAEIRMMVRKIKNRLNLPKYPPVSIYGNLMDRHQIYRFHNTFDCFVSSHRGEGWGIPQMEAMLMGRPIISTNCGGIHEYLKDGVDALLIPYKLIPLQQNSRNRQWYTPDQKWADCDVSVLRKHMRFVFENQDKAREIGNAGKQTVQQKFSFTAVGDMMKTRLEQIEKELNNV
jgi:glycosyltransferase involved in cell wall biosynthesis